ncbi:MAG: hypothetical protein LUF77_05840, partial [Oscillospiraceae bacterium]|nr:hypothetical protein [Oscillospiraceae bacterium]
LKNKCCCPVKTAPHDSASADHEKNPSEITRRPKMQDLKSRHSFFAFAKPRKISARFDGKPRAIP